ncbi:endo-1,4-beta-xylanase [uncultured Bacteroides sp.]|uniref:endo-1,4-beta-xylanase n=1 Tax=uncultured Bacteroides sp. TaxID=162156 RepID=UPI00262A643D|nr:endo-1,4-beta-xylanase [uncultured Bacteroides sp.]
MTYLKKHIKNLRINYEATANPTIAQQQKQADIYRMVIESYKTNIPKAQQSGITLWGLSDHADEHTYWFTGDTPNIFDANYARKVAYKGVCDGIAGRDISEDFTGDDWTNAYKSEETETPAQ